MRKFLLLNFALIFISASVLAEPIITKVATEDMLTSVTNKIFEQIQDRFFPIGSLVIGDNLSDEQTVKSIYGGDSWERITDVLYGSQDGTDTGTQVNEELPNVTGAFIMRYGSTYTNKVGCIDVLDDTHTAKQVAYSENQSNNRKISIDLSQGQTDAQGHYKTQSVYKDGGSVKVKGRITNIWKRTL